MSLPLKLQIKKVLAQSLWNKKNIPPANRRDMKYKLEDNA